MSKGKPQLRKQLSRKSLNSAFDLFSGKRQRTDQKQVKTGELKPLPAVNQSKSLVEEYNCRFNYFMTYQFTYQVSHFCAQVPFVSQQFRRVLSKLSNLDLEDPLSRTKLPSANK
jgi:hypothetical protein